MSLIKLASKHYKMKDLRKDRVELSKNELDEVFKNKAVWHHGTNGEETSAIWKAYDMKKALAADKGKHAPVMKYCYITNTHRAMSVSPTLKGAINKYHSFIKGTA
jgi:hypothetical protein